MTNQMQMMTTTNTVSPPRENLNPTLKGLSPSVTLSINEKCAQLEQLGRRIYPLGFGQSPFPVPQSVVEELRANASQKTYLAVKGLAELRSAVAQFHRRVNQLDAVGENVLIGPGTKELLFLLQLTYFSDLVLPAPSWVSYAPQAAILGRKVSWIQTRKENGWRLTPEELDHLCSEDSSRPRLLILNYPSNPTGLTLKAADLEGLASVAQKHRLLILSDEIYGELNHSGDHVSIANYYPEGTIVSSGLSKWCGAGGWRLGTFVFPSSLQWLLDAMSTVISETYSAVSSPIQYAAIRAFQGGADIERYVFQSRRVLRALGQAVGKRLHTYGVEVQPTEGGFYLFPDFDSYRGELQDKNITTSAQFCQRLLNETGVALLPGSDFGRPQTELTCRLAYVNFNGAECLAAAEEVADEQELPEAFVRTHCPETVEAIDLIGKWLRWVS
jgi:aspartate aminotransferase